MTRRKDEANAADEASPETQATEQVAVAKSTKDHPRVQIDYSRLSKVTKVLRLDGIDMLDMSFRSFVDPRSLAAMPEGSETAVSQGVVEARWHRDGALLDVVLGFRVVAHLRVPGAPGHQDLFAIQARLLISYALPEGFAIDDHEAEVMADLVMANGQINSFPYFRQLVVDHTSRAGWPPLTLDVFRAPASRLANIVRNAPALETITTGVAPTG